MTRLPLLRKKDIEPEYHDIFGAGMNLHRLTLHSPKLARLSRQLGLYFRNESGLSPRLRELAILQVAWLARSAYEYSHHIRIALDAGVSDAEIRAVASGSETGNRGLDPLTCAVLDAAHEISSNGIVGDATYKRLAVLPNDQIVDLLFVISFYKGFVCLTASLKVEVEPEF